MNSGITEQWALDKNIAVRLYQLRKEYGISQKELADRIGKSINVVERIEQMRHLPSLDTMCALSFYFGVSLDYIIGKTDLKTYRPTDDKDILYIRQLEEENMRLAQHCLKIPVMAKTVKSCLEKMRRVEESYRDMHIIDIGEEDEYIRAESDIRNTVVI